MLTTHYELNSIYKQTKNYQLEQNSNNISWHTKKDTKNIERNALIGF